MFGVPFHHILLFLLLFNSFPLKCKPCWRAGEKIPTYFGIPVFLEIFHQRVSNIQLSIPTSTIFSLNLLVSVDGFSIIPIPKKCFKMIKTFFSRPPHLMTSLILTLVAFPTTEYFQHWRFNHKLGKHSYKSYWSSTDTMAPSYLTTSSYITEQLVPGVKTF